MNHCKVYVDFNGDADDLQDLVDEKIGRLFDLKEVYAVAFRNESYRASTDLNSAIYPIERSRCYVEIETDAKELGDEMKFQAGVARLVSELRFDCDYVVASCEFEDYIIEQTGWNWTLEHPKPPT